MIKSYTGIRPYAFLSYSHKDIDFVFPLMKKLQQIGCNIWFDEGIHPADEWADTIAKKLSNSRFVLLMLSRNSIESQNVKREIYYAVSKKIEIVPFYIDDVELPDGLALQLGIYQAIKTNNNLIKDVDILIAAFPPETICEFKEPKLLYRSLQYSYYFCVDSIRAFSIVRYDNDTGDSKTFFQNEQPEHAEISSEFTCYSLRYSHKNDYHPYNDDAVLINVFCDHISDRYVARYYVDYHFAIVDPASEKASLKIMKCIVKNYAKDHEKIQNNFDVYDEDSIPRTWGNLI